METNVKVLGWLYIVLGILGVAVGLITLFIMLTVGFFVPEQGVFPILAVIGFFVAGLMALLSVPGIIVGVGLLKFQPWARVVALVLGALNLFNFPLGTALGIYTFVSLLTPEAEAFFRRR
jgi:hypothetical protein